MSALHDAYELGGVAGHGRATVVRLGVRRGDASPVALKQLRIEHLQDPDKRTRFIEQARRACMLQHEGIELTHDVVDGRDGPVVVAEWIDGRSLERLAIGQRRNEQVWSIAEVLLVARSLLEALRYAHHQSTAFSSQGMLHGGLWPGNVMVGTDGSIKLVDFGMASIWQEAREPWQDIESLRYLSADHVRHGASAASDLYAVGAIVHELLAGTRFRAEYETEAEMRAAIERPDPPAPPRDPIPAPLEQLRRRLLEPVQSPRHTLEQALDLCAAIKLGDDAREAMCGLVRATLRNDSTIADSDTPPQGITIASVPETRSEGIANARSRVAVAVHSSAGDGPARAIELRQIPLGQAPRPPRRRDTQSVPIPVNHEQTAARKPMFLQQTARPVGEQARNAERERSGDGSEEPSTSGPDEGKDEGKKEAANSHDIDTAPIPPGELLGIPEVISNPYEGAGEPMLDLGVTAEVHGAPRLPEDFFTGPEPELVPKSSGLLRLLRGPLGWALLGAAVAGIGIPLAARCSAEPPSAPTNGR